MPRVPRDRHPTTSPRAERATVLITPDPPCSARHIRREWVALSSLPPSGEVFEPYRTANLPIPVGTWLQHSIKEATPLARTAWLHMRGHIRIGAWRPFTATQVLVPGVGFIWAAKAQFVGIPVLAYDKYFGGAGEMRWRIGGIVPEMSARNTDIDTSAAGRLAAESVFVPTCFAGAQWSSDDSGVHATWSIDEHRETVDLDIGDNGELRGVAMQRGGTRMAHLLAATPSAWASTRNANSAASPSQPRSVPDGGGTPIDKPRVSSSARPSHMPSCANN